MILILSCIYVYYKKWIISTEKWFYIIVTHVMTFTWNYESEFSIWMLLHYTRNGDTKYQASCTMVVYLYHCWLYIFINNNNFIINFQNSHEFNYTKQAGAFFALKESQCKESPYFYFIFYEIRQSPYKQQSGLYINV